MLAYIDHLEARDELDLEATTEFLVLIAALLELKSRLMLPGEEIEELDELAPAEAAGELIERLLRYARFRGAAGWLGERKAAAEALLYRAAPLPDELRRLSVEQRRDRPMTRPCSAPRSAGCCARRRRSTSATWRCRGSRSASASRTCASCSRRGRSRSTTR